MAALAARPSDSTASAARVPAGLIGAAVASRSLERTVAMLRSHSARRAKPRSQFRAVDAGSSLAWLAVPRVSGQPGQ
jgi:hypothetical protein